MSERVFILLFRGINVGGNKVVRMETLRRVLAEGGFGKVTTYIQSGNVVLTSDMDEDSILALVGRVFAETFGFSSRPSIRSREAWARLIAENPFAAEVAADGRVVHAVILNGSPAAEALAALRALATTEVIEARDGVLYLYTPDGFGRSKVSEMLDRVLKVPLTARNWNTVLKLQEMAAGVAVD